ncbi:MAG: DUF493 domain-containing protein [Nitrospirae bacterium]|nr:DUF493 domain-containing protein [Candidatus Manganitrophaceae bacterium]
MTDLDDTDQKIVWTYPCEWTYKVIGYQEKSIRQAISEVLMDKAFEVSFSNQSRTLKYVSVNLDLVLESETEREEIYMTLKKHPAIKMVL